MLHWLARNRGLDVDTLRPYLHLLDAEAAARHAGYSGLDSMVLGETQIVGQIKDAVRAAEQWRAGRAAEHALSKTSPPPRRCAARRRLAPTRCRWPPLASSWPCRSSPASAS
ncbi:MAG: hypothetical protein U1E47_07215 [Rivihabitans pingtungensis]